MSGATGTRRGVSLLAAVLLCALSLTIVGTGKANAGTLRTKVFDFNACDQYGRSGWPDCQVTPSLRASAIVSSVLAGGSNVVTLQEVCQYTYDEILAQLGPQWNGFHLWTTFFSDNRCSPGPREWGIAIIARAPNPVNVGYAALPISSGEEPRYLLCGNFTILASFRVCASHFSDSTSAHSQAINVGGQLSSYANNGGAILLGVDANIDARNCSNAWQTAWYMRPIYVSAFGGTTSTGCETGYGTMYEADQQHIGGNGVYTAATLGSLKVDYVFFNYQKWYADYDAVSTGSNVSDHNILRGEGTLFW